MNTFLSILAEHAPLKHAVYLFSGVFVVWIVVAILNNDKLMKGAVMTLIFSFYVLLAYGIGYFIFNNVVPALLR